MELINQFQGFLGSIAFGFFFTMLFQFVWNLIKKTSFFIKILIVPTCFIGTTILYFFFLVKYVYGIMNIFYPLAIFIGILFYYFFYYRDFAKYYSYIGNRIELKRKKGIDIIKKEMRKQYGKLFKSKK